MGKHTPTDHSSCHKNYQGVWIDALSFIDNKNTSIVFIRPFRAQPFAPLFHFEFLLRDKQFSYQVLESELKKKKL